MKSPTERRSLDSPSHAVPFPFLLFCDVNVIGEVVLPESECEVVESQTFSLSKQREAFFLRSQDDINTDENLRKHLQRPGKIRGIEYGGEHRWSTLDLVVMARMEHYLDRRESPDVDIEEWEYYLLGPNEFDVDIKHMALNARGEKQQRLFHTFRQQGTSEFMVASVARWDQHARMPGIHEQKCKERSQTVKHLSDRQEMLLAMMERKKILRRKVPE